jgi:peptidoglycan/LPS O-acetylase OafA/YrhL
MLRGLAALGVVFGHVRSFIFVDYGAVATHSAPVQLFYFVTGLGHQCVLAFFALSGFLVGGSALQQILDGKWSWPRYLLRRITRLWVVLIPALLLTLGLDSAGEILGGHVGYEGNFYHLIGSGPTVLSPTDLSMTTFAGNVLFLQTILTPVFGTDGPLWSLANEFWYYAMFPFMMAGLFGGSRWSIRALMGGIGVVLAILLPRDIVLLGLVWVAGAIAHYVIRVTSRRSQSIGILLLPINVLFLGAAIFVDKYWPAVSSDLVLGFAFACMLPALVLLPNIGSIYSRGADSLAKISYTLYATHFPVLAFIWFVVIAPQKWTISSLSIAIMSLLVVTALLASSAMWWLFERNTDWVRHVIESSFLVRRQPEGRKSNTV